MAAMNINEKQFQKMIDEKQTFLVDYWAPWCGYCRRIAPAYEQIANAYDGTFAITKINIDEEGALAQAEKIEVIPTLVLYRDGKAIDTIVAPQSKAAIEAFIRKNLSEQN